MGGEGGGASRKFRKAVKKFFLQTCGSFCQKQQTYVDNSSAAVTISRDSPIYAGLPENPTRVDFSCKKTPGDAAAHPKLTTSRSSNKSLCAICLDLLNYSSGEIPAEAIFTAECFHAFHFACITSNVRHGSVTCPICRAHWTQLPRSLNPRCSLLSANADPILQILDDSIANSRVHRRSFLLSARYDDDDPVEPDHTTNQPRLHLSLLTAPPPPHGCHSSSSSSPDNSAYLRVKLAHQPATDLVLVASPNGPHLRLMKQAMAAVVLSLRPTDRLAIVTYSSAAARVFPLRRTTASGKRTALRVIDRLFYTGEADPVEGLKKGVKVLGDRLHKNTQSCILHLTDSPAPARTHHHLDMEAGSVAIHRFHVGFGFGASNGFVMRQFEEFLARTVGGAVRDIQMRMNDGATVVRIEELRGGEERIIPIYLPDYGAVCVEYSYSEGAGDGECVMRGEAIVDAGEKGDVSENGDGVGEGGRISSAESWDYHDPFMARRWAKHLHAYRL